MSCVYPSVVTEMNLGELKTGCPITIKVLAAAD